MKLKKIKGQTTIELLILLSISMVALTIIFSIYIDQLNASYSNQDFFLAKSSVQKLVSSANVVYYSGAGSEIKVEFEFPRDTDFIETGFYGPEIVVKLKNGHSYVGGADVNVIGNFKPNSGKNVVYMFYDGNVVTIHYNDFEVNKQNITSSIIQGQQLITDFTIRNNTQKIIKFYLEKNFSHEKILLNINSSETFEILPGEIKKVNLEFLSNTSSQGNYSGFILVKGQIDDINFSKKINVAVEVLTKKSELVIYPKITSFNINYPNQVVKSFSVCNNSVLDIVIDSWGSNGSVDKNASKFIESLPNFYIIPSKDCNFFDLTFQIEEDTIKGIYDGNFFIMYNDSNIVFSDIFINVE
ncbi:MAG TPA: hypothetical protein PKK60_01700 [archaeon]|nr:hypothetical protein [archaeon]